MRRKFIFITIFLVISFNAFSYSTDREFFSLERKMKGVKMIAEKQRHNWKTLSYFDKDGFLLQEICYRKNTVICTYQYEYSILDTLLVVKTIRYQNNDLGGYSVDKYYYNSLKQCYRSETYLSKDLENPAGVLVNFIYQDGLLQSFEGHSFSRDQGDFYKYVYVYDDNQRTELFYTYDDSLSVYGGKSISIYENGKLIDFIKESAGGQAIISGEILWSKNRLNKVHSRYSNFDKSENWRRSYFMTEKGRKFRSKRKIEYW